MSKLFSNSMAINEACDELNAMQRNYGGPNEPVNPAPHQWWPDEASGLLKQCNQAATGWIVRGYLNQPYFGMTPIDGWMPIDTVLSYASATTMNSSADLTGTIPQYAKLRWKQGGDYKYAYLTNITSILWTINAGTNYSLTNAPVTDVAWSFGDHPVGFPYWINVDLAPDGFASLTTKSGKFRMNGREATFVFACSGTSKESGFSIPIPIVNGVVGFDFPLRVTDSTAGTVWGMGEIPASVGYMTVYSSASGGGFTSTGTKGVLNGIVKYVA
jgi:hypothetical protein